MSDSPSNKLLEWDKKVGVAQILSFCALLASLIMPLVTSLVTYRVLAPSVEELKSRPKLQTATSVKDLAPDGSSAFRLEITNIGTYPARSLQIVLYPWKTEAIDSNYIQLAPALEHDMSIEGPVVRLTLKRPIAPGQHVSVFIHENPMSIGVQTEYGDYTSVYSNSGGGRSSW